MQSWIKSGLRDFLISRALVDWGIPVPDDDKQTIYVNVCWSKPSKDGVWPWISNKGTFILPWLMLNQRVLVLAFSDIIASMVYQT